MLLLPQLISLMVIGIMTKKHNTDVITMAEVPNFGFVSYVMGYTIDNGLHCDVLVKGIPIEDPSDVHCHGSYVSITPY